MSKLQDVKKVDRLAYSVSEAAQALGLGKTTIYALMQKGMLPFCRVGTHRRIRCVDIEALIATDGSHAAGASITHVD